MHSSQNYPSVTPHPSAAKAVKLIDVARQLGISQPTVSRALADHPRISSRVKQQVLACAKELGYRREATRKPSITRNENAIRPQTIDFVFCRLVAGMENNPQEFQTQILQGAQDAAKMSDGGRPVQVRVSHDAPGDLSPLIEQLSASDGVILTGYSSPELVARLLERNVKVVLADHEHPGMAVDAVVLDNLGGAVLATEHLLSLGYRRIGFLGMEEPGGQRHPSLRGRYEGFYLALGRRGLTPEARDVRWAPFTQEGVETTFAAWADEGDLPEALLMASELASPLVLHALRERGKSCPGDMGLLVFDNALYANLCRPLPTRMATFPAEIGRKAMNRLRARLSGGDDTPQITVVPLSRIDGATLRPAAPVQG